MTENLPQKSIWPDPLVENFNDSDWPNLDLQDAEVLKWVTEHKRVLLRTITWNLCAKPPPPKEELCSNLLIRKFHIYVFGTEECERSIAQSAINPSKKNWESFLNECLSPMYVPLRSHTLQAIHLMLFVHKAIAPLCSVVTSAAVPTGVGNTLGNKGGVGVYLKIGNTRMLVVNAHLTAHQNAVRQRNNDFNKINRNLPVLLEKKDIGKGEVDVPITMDTVPPAKESASVSENEKLTTAEPPPPGVQNPDAVPDVNTNTSNNEAENLPTSSVSPVPAPSPAVTSENPSAPVAEHDSDSESEEMSPRYSKSIPSDSVNDLNARDLRQLADIVIFMGDLNYRVRGNRSIIDKLLESNMHEVLLSNDQLKMSMQQNEVFQGYTEPPLNFKPTYKYDIGTNVYDSGSKQRIPSWTDRILYVPANGLECLSYNCDNSISTSDHKPVYASFMVPINLFVSLDEKQNAVLPSDLSPKFTSESQVCTIM